MKVHRLATDEMKFKLREGKYAPSKLWTDKKEKILGLNQKVDRLMCLEQKLNEKYEVIQPKKIFFLFRFFKWLFRKG